MTRDDGSYSNLGSHNTRLTVTNTGWYLLNADVEWAANATGQRQIYVQKNGVATQLLSTIVGANAAGTTVQALSGLLYLTGADYVEVWGLQNSGGALSTGHTQGAYPNFSIARIASPTAGLTPDSKPNPPTAYDDEFEGAAPQANWVWQNQGTATAVTNGQGALVLTAPLDASRNERCYVQPLPAGTTWKFRAKLSVMMPAVSNFGGMILYESGTGKLIAFGMYNNTALYLAVAYETHFTTNSSTPLNVAQSASVPFSATPWLYLEIERNGSNLYWRLSTSGEAGTFVQIYTAAVNAFLTTAPDNIGFFAASLNGSTAVAVTADWFRRIS